MCNYNDAKPTMSKGLLITAGAVSLLSLMLAISGCAVGPDFVKPEAKVNADWNEKGDPRVATQTAVNSKWWSSFNDPTLDQLIQLAYKQNLPLQIAGLRIMGPAPG